MSKAKPFSDICSDKIVAAIKTGPDNDPAIIIVTEHNVYEIYAGEIELLRFKDEA